MVRGLTVTVLTAVMLLTGTGCAWLLIGGAAAGAGSVYYLKGELRATEPVSMDDAYGAAEAVLQELQFTVTDRGRDAKEARIDGTGLGDRPIIIRMWPVGPRVTEIGIRFGAVGDQDRAGMILRRMRAHFPTMP